MEHKKDYGTLAVLGRFMRRRWKKPALFTTLGATAIGVAGFCYLHPYGQWKQPATTLAPASAGGQVESLRYKGIGSPFDGAVLQMAVQPGQSVKQGQLLFRMDTSSFQTALQAARQEAKAARAGLSDTYRSRAAELRPLEQEVATARAEMRPTVIRQPNPDGVEEMRLEGDGDSFHLVPAPQQEVIVQQQDPEAQARFQAAQQQLAERRQAWEPALQQARERITSADAQVHRLAEMMAGAERRSPFTGIVSATYAQAGQAVTGGVPLVRIEDPNSYRVVAKVHVTARDAVRPGSRVQLTLADGTTEGKVEKVLNGSDQDVFYSYLWVKPATPRTLHPNEPVQVKLPTMLVASR